LDNQPKERGWANLVPTLREIVAGWGLILFLKFCTPWQFNNYMKKVNSPMRMPE
jgi:hypothetical protein